MRFPWPPGFRALCRRRASGYHRAIVPPENPAPSPANKRVGVAILANDGIYDWLLPFLESFREHNPSLPTYLIPFDNRMARTARAARAYDVTLVTDDLAPIDRLAWHVYPFFFERFRRRLRKFHCLALPLDEVLYIDVDTIALRDFTPLFGHVRPGEADFIIASTSPGWVYNEKRQNYPDLANAVRFSDGFFVTAPRILSRDRMIEVMRRDRRIFREVRKPKTFAQPVANFTVHRLGLQIASLTDLMPWASTETFYLAEGVSLDPTGPKDKDGKDIFFAHWAGAHDLPTNKVFDGLWHDYAARAARRTG